jgi:hypothetical protein
VTNTWMWVAVFATLLAIGFGVMLGGIVVVVRSLSQRRTPSLAASVAVPAAPAPVVPERRPDALTPSDAPMDEWQDEVPTAVFRASDYKDIEALMQDADKYVSKHKGDED